MEQNSRFSIFLLALLYLPFIFSDAREISVIPGGWAPIEDLNDPHVKEIAEFAISEHNKQSNSNLKLVKVVKGEQQVVAGMRYRLDLMATALATTETYEAVVWEQAWTKNPRRLSSFNLVKG